MGPDQIGTHFGSENHRAPPLLTTASEDDQPHLEQQALFGVEQQDFFSSQQVLFEVAQQALFSMQHALFGVAQQSALPQHAEQSIAHRKQFAHPSAQSAQGTAQQLAASQQLSHFGQLAQPTTGQMSQSMQHSQHGPAVVLLAEAATTVGFPGVSAIVKATIAAVNRPRKRFVRMEILH